MSRVACFTAFLCAGLVLSVVTIASDPPPPRGILDPPACCGGFPCDTNNASCICNSATPRACEGSGFHWTTKAAPSYTEDPNGATIVSDPRPCGCRYKCSITAQGIDGESPCTTIPGCQFWEDYPQYYGTHPNYTYYVVDP